MKWIERLTDCIDYIEEHLKEDIDMSVVCDTACLTQNYFFRLFEAVTGVGLSEYIRRRRMTLAARELMDSQRKVIDLAYDYGYSSPEAFSRAFKNIHGISPSDVREGYSAVKSFHRLVFNISIKGAEEMEYRIEQKDAFRVIGRSILTTCKNGQNMKDITEFWADANSGNLSRHICNYSSQPDIMMGICFEEESDGSFKYAIASPYSNGESADLDVLDIPEARWAIFDSVGPIPGTLQEVWRRIFAEWLPATGFELENFPQIEYYYSGDITSEDYRCEVWIPIKDQ